MKTISGKYRRAAELRQQQTDAERQLWMQLRNRQFKGIKFKRQQPIGKFFIDFVSLEQKIIIEVDGGQHNTDEGKLYDDERTKNLESQGYIFVRFWDTDVLKDIDSVLARLDDLTQPSHPCQAGELLTSAPR